MSVTDRAAAAAAYVQPLLYDQEVHSAVRQMAMAGHKTYQRALAKGPAKAVKDKRLRRRASQTMVAAWQVWAALDAAQARPRPRRARRLSTMVIVAGSVFGLYLASDADRRGALRRLIPSHAPSSQSSA